jgi:hypothetical protein
VEFDDLWPRCGGLNRHCDDSARHFGATDGGGGVPATHFVAAKIQCGKSEGGDGAGKVAVMTRHFNCGAAKVHLVAAKSHFGLPEMPVLIHKVWAGDCAFRKGRATGKFVEMSIPRLRRLRFENFYTSAKA